METAQKEEWLQIEDYPDYFVSNLGRVKSLKTEHTKFNVPHILKPGLHSNGYAAVSLLDNGSQRTFKIHRLVLIAFKGHRSNEYEVNHINGIKSDNRLANLEWVTKKGNARHAWQLGLIATSGEGNPAAKLSKTDVLLIKQMHQSGYSNTQIARHFPVKRSAIYDVVSGRTWKFIED